MKYGDPIFIKYAVWVIFFLIVFFVWAYKKEESVLKSYADSRLLGDVYPLYGRDRKAARMALDIVVVFLILVALARPQWGFYWTEDKNKGRDILIAIDTSNSMLAQDVKPNRLSFAQMEVGEFIKKLKNDRIGLIAFSGSAFLQCPLTIDYSGAMIALEGFNVDVIPQGGTSLPSAIAEAVRSYGKTRLDDKVLIIITDGENTEGDIEKALKDAKKEKITIHCIGIGTAEGVTIPVLDEKGERGLLKDKRGDIVKSRLDENTLKTVADKTGGMYVRATPQDIGLEKIFRERLSMLKEREEEEALAKVYKERFQIPLGAAMFFLFAEMIIRKKI